MLMGAAVLFMGYVDQSVVEQVVYGLLIACFLTAHLLFQLLVITRETTLDSQHPIWCSMLRLLPVLTALAACVTAYLFEPAAALPLLASFMCEALLSRTSFSASLGVCLIVTALFILIVPQRAESIASALFVLVLAFWGDYLLRQLGLSSQEIQKKDMRVNALEQRLETQRTTISAIEQQGRQAERNRLAARIHDKVGHGMTGSIFMIEAARLQIDTNPQAAKASLETAAENLRSSVDQIRRDLHEERAENDAVSLKLIADTLTALGEEHAGIRTELILEGDLEVVSQTVWVCVYECMLESFTNMLKHSNGNRFRVTISQSKQLVYVSFRDNGVSAHASEDTAIEKGIGLSRIEERCLLCGGKCFFSHSSSGFVTRITFTLKGGLS